MRLKKSEQLKEMEDKAKLYLANKSILDAEDQTKITLFLQTAKGTNLVGLSSFQMTPLIHEEWVGYRFFHNQFFRELELSTLLGKSTQWSINPFLYTQASLMNAQFTMHSQVYKFMMNTSATNRHFVEYLALSHSVMTVISFIRLLPPDRALEGSFWLAIQEIEKNDQVQQQVQVRLLKDEKKEYLPKDITEEEKEEIVYQYRKIVENYFTDFLGFLLKG